MAKKKAAISAASSTDYLVVLVERWSLPAFRSSYGYSFSISGGPRIFQSCKCCAEKE
jgi:hypothetical protein